MKIYLLLSFSIVFSQTQWSQVDIPENQNMVKFLETLDDEDDVQNVYTNVNFED